jgi:hypothetical protein
MPDPICFEVDVAPPAGLPPARRVLEYAVDGIPFESAPVHRAESVVTVRAPAGAELDLAWVDASADGCWYETRAHPARLTFIVGPIPPLADPGAPRVRAIRRVS